MVQYTTENVASDQVPGLLRDGVLFFAFLNVALSFVFCLIGKTLQSAL